MKKDKVLAKYLFYCELCSKFFRSFLKQVMHLKKHAGHALECECGYVSQDAFRLHRHWIRRHQGSNIYPDRKIILKTNYD